MKQPLVRPRGRKEDLLCLSSAVVREPEAASDQCADDSTLSRRAFGSEPSTRNACQRGT